MSVFNYLQTPQPQLVQNYAAPDSTLMARSTNNLLQQQEQGRGLLQQQADIFSQERLKANALPEIDRESYLQKIAEKEQQLNQLVENRGLRGARNQIGQLAREFQEEINPYRQGIQRFQSLRETIDSSQADAVYKQFGRGLLQQNVDTGGIQGFQAPEIINTFEGWKDLRKDIIDYSSRFQNTTEARSEVYSDEQGRYIMRSLVETGRADEFQAAALHSLLKTDPQAINQLRVMAMQRHGTQDVTEEQVIDEALMLVEPEYLARKGEKRTNIERSEIDVTNYQTSWSPTSEFVSTPENKITSYTDIQDSNMSFEAAMQGFDIKSEEILDDLKGLPEYVGHEIIMTPEDGYILVNERNQRVHDDRLLGLNIQRNQAIEEQAQRQQLLNRIVSDVTDGEYSDMDSLLEATNFDEALEQEKGRVIQEISARRGMSSTSFWQNMAAGVEDLPTEEQIREIAEQNLTTGSQFTKPRFSIIRQINERLEAESQSVSRNIAPQRLPRKATDVIEENTASFLRSGRLIGRKGEVLHKDKDVLETINMSDAKIEGVIYTPEEGYQLVFRPTATTEKPFDDIVRVPVDPNSSMMSDLVNSGAVDVASLGYAHSLQQIRRSPNNSGSVAIYNRDQETSHNISVQGIPEGNHFVYNITIPNAVQEVVQDYTNEINTERRRRNEEPLPLIPTRRRFNSENEVIAFMRNMQYILSKPSNE